MQGFTAGQKRVLSDFFITIAAGWFGAGVITTFFIRPIVIFESIINIVIGMALAFFSLNIALYLVKEKR